MGAADIIPGVSGGTIALITGIYEELIEAIQQAKEDGIHLAELEPLGFTERTSNALERVGILLLGDLIYFSWDELMRVEGMGFGAKKEILKVISTLEHLDEKIEAHIDSIMPNKHQIQAIRDWGLEAVLAGAY